MPAVPALIAVGGTIGTLAYQHRQAKKAAATQTGAEAKALAATNYGVDQAIGVQREQMDYDRWLNSATGAARQPYLDAASAESGQDWTENGEFDPHAFVAPTFEDIKNDPGYQFSLDQGQKFLDRHGSSGGTINTGARTTAGLKFSQGLAAQEYGHAFDRAYSTHQANESGRVESAKMRMESARMKQSASLSRVDALMRLASLASPGQYPGYSGGGGGGFGTPPGERGPGYGEPGYVAPYVPWRPGMQRAGSDRSVDPDPNFRPMLDETNAGLDPRTMPYGPSYINNPYDWGKDPSRSMGNQGRT
jgi:hypothetical protein